MKLSALAFDWDGTIVDSFTNQFEWFHYWAKHPHNNGEKSIPFTNVEDFRTFYNVEISKPGKVQNIYDALGLDCDMSDKNHPVWEAFIQFYKKNPPKLIQGIDKIIPELYKMGQPSKHNNKRIRIHIKSSNTWNNIEPMLLKSGLIDYIDSYITSELLDEIDGSLNSKHIHKPSKVSVAYSLGYLGSQGKNTMYFGDTLDDLKATRDVVVPTLYEKQNLITIGCPWGFETKDNLIQGVETNIGRYQFNHILNHQDKILPLVEDYMKNI